MSSHPQNKFALNTLRDRQLNNGLWDLKLLKNNDKDLPFWIALAICRIEADFMVTVVEAEITPSGIVQCRQVIDIPLNDISELGQVLATIPSEAKDAILIISAMYEYGTVDYEFKTEHY